jgi:hypothetical protein
MEQSDLSKIDTKSVIFRLGTVGAAVFGLYLTANVIMGALAAGLGFFALGGLALMGAATWRLIPLLAQKFDNRVLLERKKEARDMPVEQMQNGIVAMKQDALSQKMQIEADAAKIKNFHEEMSGLMEKYPDRDYSGMQAKVNSAIKTLEAKAARYNATVGEIQELEKNLEILQSELRLAEIQLSGADDPETLKATEERRLLMNESFNSIRERISQGFAGMEVNNLGVLKQLPKTGIDTPYKSIDKAEIGDQDLGLELKIDFKGLEAK